ncbi:flagellar hook-basal body complex protein FliE [Mesorhizobium sp. KR9-304]|uniref:flagellar hook-basal body complex protein FliE n=1 Tax=Mesorhizobium sp. KR9-304 TaxID=3156614 RepID=UPI0032B3D1E9
MIGGIGAIDFKAIGSASQLGQGSPAAATGTADATGSFASVLSDLATRTVGTLERAEELAVQGIQGQADTREVVDAVMSAEQALTAAVAIRDKIVSAYMEISRMAI